MGLTNNFFYFSSFIETALLDRAHVVGGVFLMNFKVENTV